MYQSKKHIFTEMNTIENYYPKKKYAFTQTLKMCQNVHTTFPSH